MIYVQKLDDMSFGVKFKPIPYNLERIKSIPTAHFDGEKQWIIELKHFTTFEDLFRGEFIYITPRHALLNLPPPPLPKMYEKIPNHKVDGIKEPYSLYDYQKFGANFLACIAGGTGHAFLADAVGTGRLLQNDI